MTNGQLIEWALGAEEARKVDTAIPQHIFDAMTPVARENAAGWYYAPEASFAGRLLTVEECWALIRLKLRNGKLKASVAGGVDIGLVAGGWPCLRYHVTRGEIRIEEA